MREGWLNRHGEAPAPSGLDVITLLARVLDGHGRGAGSGSFHAPVPIARDSTTAAEEPSEE